LAAARDDLDRAEQEFKRATSLMREFDLPFWLAVTQLEHAEWLVEQGRTQEAKPLLVEARETFERLEATPWVDRAGGISGWARARGRDRAFIEPLVERLSDSFVTRS
jgi:ATP/maltotriose-dependent transcriptional regulator MalT